MEQSAETIFERIRRNFDVYLTMAMSVAVAILGICEVVEAPTVSSAVLGTLALVSFSLLRNRRTDETIQETLSGLDELLLPNRGLLAYKFDAAEYIEAFSRAEKVLIFGAGYTVLVPIMRDHFGEGLPSGLTMRVLLMDPTGAANEIAAFRANRTVEDLESLYQRNLSLLAELAERTDEDRLEYRVIDYLPPYNLLAIDPHRPNGTLYVRLAAWRASTVQRPVIVLSRDQDTKWFEYFVSQFESMWSEASQWN